jgi:phage baseplate assembly protein W
MAIPIGNIKLADLYANAYKVLGITINQSSNAGGVFGVNYTTLQQAKSNLINLILTRKGERVAQPEFGCDIWKVLFEPIIQGQIDQEIERTIIEAVNIWLPYLQINQIFLEYTPEQIDSHTISVELDFSLVSNPNINDTVTININSD